MYESVGFQPRQVGSDGGKMATGAFRHLTQSQFVDPHKQQLFRKQQQQQQYVQQQQQRHYAHVTNSPRSSSRGSSSCASTEEEETAGGGVGGESSGIGLSESELSSCCSGETGDSLKTNSCRTIHGFCRFDSADDLLGRDDVIGGGDVIDARTSCRQQTRQRQRDFPHSTLHHAATDCQFCDTQPPSPAVTACVTCRARYCDSCLRATHPRKPPFTTHRFLPVEQARAVLCSGGSSGGGGVSSAGGGSSPPGGVSVAFCFYHSQNVAEVLCTTCELALCKCCCLHSDHENHRMTSVTEWCGNKKLELEKTMIRLHKQTVELKRNVDSIDETCRQIESNASQQQSKLQAECEVLIRIIQERRESIGTRINETKANRLRQLRQRGTVVRECVERNAAVVGDTKDVLCQEHDQQRFVNNAKLMAERILEAHETSKQAGGEMSTAECPAFFLDFAQERHMLENLKIVEVPHPARICEELCTQSHDKVTLQWRSPDHRHVTGYELQYAVADHQGQQHDAAHKLENWMIVPNIRECRYTVNGLQSGTTYMFVVKTSNKAGSCVSDVVSIKTLGIPFQFDAHSMHKKLRLANHGYTVTRDVRDGSGAPSSGSSSVCGVTGSVAIESGRHYWEVVVCHSTAWTVGVAHSDVARFEWAGRNNKSWVISRFAQSWIARHDNKETVIHMAAPYPKKIGVLLDYDSHEVTLFDGASGRRLHVFRPSAPFLHPLRPTFALANKSLTINTGITVPDHLQLASSADF